MGALADAMVDPKEAAKQVSANSDTSSGATELPAARPRARSAVARQPSSPRAVH